MKHINERHQITINLIEQTIITVLDIKDYCCKELINQYGQNNQHTD